MRSSLLPLATAALLLLAPPALPAEPETDAAPESNPRALRLANKPWKGDFEEIRQRHLIRVAVPFSRTLYFNDKGEERGITAGSLRDFERWMNRKYRVDNRPITLYVIPTTRDRLLADVDAGLADIAAGNITVTESRKRLVDMVALTENTKRRFSEVIVTGPASPPLASLDDLSGKTVHVRPATSYYESLRLLNLRLKASGKAPMELAPLPDALEDEDKLEMLNAGLLEYVVADDWLAKIWAQVLPQIRVQPELAVRTDAMSGWAIRKESPQLRGVIAEFLKEYVDEQGVMAYRLSQYLKNIEQIHNPKDTAEWQRFEAIVKFFEQYGARYDFDPLMLAAQGFQESRLDQNVKSKVGAIGVMQVMPATGKELGVGDVRVVEANIHAGTKYLDQLMTRYFQDAHFDETNRPLFAFAAYNAGPGRISSMRKEAVKRGLDPDKWFNNVEIVVAEKVGTETTTYVRNIYKYYAAYKLTEEAAAQRKAIRKDLEQKS